MPEAALVALFDQMREEHHAVGRALVSLAERVAIETVADVLSGAHALAVQGEYNEDGLRILRIQRVLGAGGEALFDVDDGHDDRAVEEAIDLVDTEYLDLLIDLTGDEYLGSNTIQRSGGAPVVPPVGRTANSAARRVSGGRHLEVAPECRSSAIRTAPSSDTHCPTRAETTAWPASDW